MAKLKLTSWNIEHFKRIFEGQPTASKLARRAGIAREIREIDPDILCVLEGPSNVADLKDFVQNDLSNGYTVIESSDGVYATLGSQWIWFLVKNNLAPKCSLLPIAVYKQFAGASWTVHYWGSHQNEIHRHYRHPQTLVFNWNGLRVEFIGLHLKSKFVNSGEQMWNAGGTQRETFVEESLKARIKLATEAVNVRNYIDERFRQTEQPAIFVMGDLNDGPGKEYFENLYLFFDLLSNVQGDVFFAKRFLNHALFDFADDLRWSATFDDFVENVSNRNILIDHIMFTQGLVNDALPLTVKPKAGLVEHAVHELVNATLTTSAKTSDHRPVSVEIEIL